MAQQATNDYVRKLHQQGKLQDNQVLAAAKFQKLVYSGFSSKSINLDRVDCQAKYHPNLAAVPLSRLPSDVSSHLTLVLIHEKTLIDLGISAGAQSRTDAYRVGLRELQRCLNVAYAILC